MAHDALPTQCVKQPGRCIQEIEDQTDPGVVLCVLLPQSRPRPCVLERDVVVVLALGCVDREAEQASRITSLTLLARSSAAPGRRGHTAANEGLRARIRSPDGAPAAQWPMSRRVIGASRLDLEPASTGNWKALIGRDVAARC